ncbi:MAG: hypothetical protein J0L84_17495 [Verrucomicrobia bacterium]|nr:hypothetical protein [Verrucomicrobiota bacterium]
MFRARSADDGVSFAPEHPLGLDAGVCACCSLRALADSEGALWVLYRAFRPDPGDRPTVLVRSATGEAPWEPMLSDAWPALQCPMSSGSLVEMPRGILAAWETRGAIRIAVAPRKGPKGADPAIRTWGQRARHPALAVTASGASVCAWAEGTGWQRGGAISWQALEPSGQGGDSPGEVTGLPVWSAPAVFAGPDGGWVVTF